MDNTITTLATKIRTTNVSSPTSIFSQVIDADYDSFVIIECQSYGGVTYFQPLIDGTPLGAVQWNNTMGVSSVTVPVPKGSTLAVEMYQTTNNTDNRVNSIKKMIVR